MPRAKINIKTNASNVNTNVSFALNTTATTLNEDSKTVPAKKAEQQKHLRAAPGYRTENIGNSATALLHLRQVLVAPMLNDVSAGSGECKR